MIKHITLTRILFLLCIVFLLLLIVAGTSFYFGYQHQKETVQLLQNEKAVREHEYAKSLQIVRNESSRAMNDYVTSCYEYQKLRVAYEELYKRYGLTSGLPKYTSPDDARGNEDSCYRLVQ